MLNRVSYLCLSMLFVSLSLSMTARAADDVDVTPLGDLSTYSALAGEAMKALNADDLKGAKAKLRDVEGAWDDAEATMKPKSAAAWTFVDKKIDHALAAIRAAKPDTQKCKDAVQELIDSIATPKKK